MTWKPIAFLPPQYETDSGVPYSGAVLKAYAAGTSTPIPFATDYTGATTTTSIVLNASGFTTYNGSVVIPHVQVNYNLALYPTQAAADANSGAIWTIPNIQIADATNTSFVQYFDGDGTTTAFTLSQNFGTDEKILMIFADRKLPDLIANGTFASDTIWTKGAGWTIAGGVAVATGAISTALSQTSAIPLIQYQAYDLEFTVTAAAGTVTPSIGGNSGTTRGAGTFRETIIAGSNQTIAFTGVAFTGTIDNVTWKPCFAAQRQILRPVDDYVVSAAALTLTEAPPTGTKNIIVFAPSQLLGAANNAAAAAATSEANALTYSNNASASATAAAASATTASTQATNSATSATAAAASATSASNRATTSVSGSKTFALVDKDTFQRYTGSGGHTWTVPTNAAVAFANDSEIDVWNGGTGNITLTASTGVTVNGVTSPATGITIPPYNGGSLKKNATNTWDWVGISADGWV